MAGHGIPARVVGDRARDTFPCRVIAGIHSAVSARNVAWLYRDGALSFMADFAAMAILDDR